MAADNTSLGEFNLTGLAPAPRGIPKIEVTFDIDSNGILNVTAKDQATGKSQSIRITGSTRLSEQEKQNMVEQAEQFAEQDKQAREKAEKRNEAENLCYQAEKTVTEFESKISDELKQRIEQAIRDTRDAIKKEDFERLSGNMATLSDALKEVGNQVYTQAPEENRTPYAQPDVDQDSGQSRPSGSGSRGKVVDTDYREI